MTRHAKFVVVALLTSLLTGCPVGDKYVLHNLDDEAVTIHFKDEALSIPAGGRVEFLEYDHVFKRDASSDPFLPMDIGRESRCWNLNKSSVSYDSETYFGEGRRRLVSLVIHPDGNIYRIPYEDRSASNADLIKKTSGPFLKSCSVSDAR